MEEGGKGGVCARVGVRDGVCVEVRGVRGCVVLCCVVLCCVVLCCVCGVWCVLCCVVLCCVVCVGVWACGCVGEGMCGGAWGVWGMRARGVLGFCSSNTVL